MKRVAGQLTFNIGTAWGGDGSLRNAEKEVTVALGLDVLFRVPPAPLTHEEKLQRLVT